MPFAMLLMFALTLFASASLLFLVQPLVGKLLLPYMGGTPAVWNTCMVFFQALLLAGYGYAHGLGQIKSVRKQLLIHALVLLLPLLPLFLLRFDVGIISDNVWAPPSADNPVPWLLAVLALVAGLPFFVVSTTAPLLQKWFAGTSHPDARDPYFLYGASNVGSMGSLLLYPALIEPSLFLQSQSLGWAFGYVLLALLILICGWLAISFRSETMPAMLPGSPASTEAPAEDDAPPSWFTRIRWVLLAFVPSSVMIGCTTHLTTDIAAVPLLWILPLAVYLASFIFVFSRLPMWLNLTVFLLLPVVLIGWLLISHLEIRQPASEPHHLFQGRLAYLYSLGYQLFNIPLEGFNLRHLLTLAAIGALVGCCFGSPQSIHILMVVLAPIAGLAIAFEGQLRDFFGLHEFERILLHVGVLFIVAMVCHGELARTRPAAQYLTGFYLLMSLGGVLGGLFNALIAPTVFDRIVEYPLMVAAMLLLMPWPGSNEDRGWGKLDCWVVVTFGTVIGLFLTVFFVAKVYVQAQTAQEWVEQNVSKPYYPIGHFLAGQLAQGERSMTFDDGTIYKVEILKRERNFFGTFTVVAETVVTPEGDASIYHKMFHGTTTHGVQLREEKDANGNVSTIQRKDAFSYFHQTGPIGDLFANRYDLDRPLKVAVIGVGTGTLAAYARPGWDMTFYDIDPVVVEVAQDPQYFTFLSDARERGVKIDMILGDGRQEFKKAEDGAFDLVVMDAFTSDAVPLHLLTREAVQIYRKKLRPGGVILFNIANRYLSFDEVLGNLCEDIGMVGVVSNGSENHAKEIYASSWVVIANDEEALGWLPYLPDLTSDGETQPDDTGGVKLRWSPLPTRPSLGVWTDDYANLLSVFHW